MKLIEKKEFVRVWLSDGAFPDRRLFRSDDFFGINGAGVSFRGHYVDLLGLLSGQLMFPVEWGKEKLRAQQAFKLWLEMSDSLPANASISAVLATPPPENRPPLSSRPIHKPSWGSAITAQEDSYKYAYSHPCLVFTVFYNGPVDEVACTVFQPLLACGPAVNTITMMPYADAVNLTSWLTPHGDRYYSEGAIIGSTAAAEDVLAAAIQAVGKTPRLSVVFEERAIGAVESVDQHAMAFPHRSPLLSCKMLAHWTDVDDDATSEAAVAALHRQIDAAGLITGAVHLQDYVDKFDGVAAWGPQHEKKVKELQNEYDPAMVLMVNHPS